MLVTPDTSELQEDVVPGEYKVRIVDAQVGEWQSKEPGKPATKYVKWALETFDEPDAKNNGRRIYHNTPISGRGAFLIQNFYRAAMGEDLSGAFDTEQMQGREMSVVVDINDRGYPEVKATKSL